MPLSTDIEATIDENCVEVLRPHAALTEDEQLDLCDFEDALHAVGGHTAKLRALRIVGEVNEDLSPERVRQLLALPALAGLEILMVPRCRLGRAGGAILGAASLPKLRYLDVRQTAIGDAGARALASNRLASQLEHLSIAGAFLTAQGFQALLDSPLGKRPSSLHVEEEGQGESIIPTLMERLYKLGQGNDAMVAQAFARLLQHPALTQESRDELRYQWDLVLSN